MNFFESDIITLKAEIKRMEEHPEPLELKTNKMRYKLAIKDRQDYLEHLRKGKPVADVGFWAQRLSRAMGFMPTYWGSAARESKNPLPYQEKARELGLPVDNTCDRMYMLAGMLEGGYMPNETPITATNYACLPAALQRYYIATRKGEDRSYFVNYRPFEDNEATIEYLVAQFHEFIEFAEKMFPGVIKYDEDRLVELQTQYDEAFRLYFEMYQMLKHKPAPYHGHDVRYGHEEPNYMNLEYLRARRDEIAERIEKGIGAVPDEQLRVLWAVPAPRFMDPYKVLAKNKVAVIWWYGGTANYFAPLPKTVYYGGRKLTPLEKEAAEVSQFGFGGTGAKWVDKLIWIARDLKVDAIINFDHLGCCATLGLARLVEERAEKELGIPTLQLEGKQWDQNYASEAQVTAKLDEFCQMLLSQRGLA